MDSINKDYIKIRSKVKYCIFLCMYFLAYPFCRLIYGRKNKWMICERGNDAQDNAFFFFQYLVEKHKEIEPIFVIDKKSPDYFKVVRIGKTVQYGSIRHFLMAIGYSIKISSHLYGYCPWVNFVLYLRRNKTRDLHVYLEHGVTKNMMLGDCGDVNKSIKLVTCSSRPEYDYVTKSYKFDSDVPKYTGFARFDSLVKDAKANNQILFMPTWRRYLTDLSKNEFTETDFFKHWNELINDTKLIRYCKDNNLTIKFYLHFVLRDYIDVFVAKNAVVKIVSFSEEDVQTLLKESKMLVTDFSSVFFDFAYLQRPMVYFQFDEERYNKEHYKKGFFDYRENGFGPVVCETHDAVDEIIKICKNNFKIEDRYYSNMQLSYPLRDDNNCDRIFNEIIKKINNE